LLSAYIGFSIASVAADKRIGRTIVHEHRFVGTLKFGNDALCQHLAQFDAPLVEGIDVPDRPLREYAVLVEGDKFSKGFGGEFFDKNSACGPVTLTDPVRDKPFRCTLGRDLLLRLSEGQGLGLSEEVGHEQIMMPSDRVERLAEADKITRNEQPSCATGNENGCVNPGPATRHFHFSALL